MFISIYIMKVFVVILALAVAVYAAYMMKKKPENKKSMFVFMALGLAIAWLTTAAEIQRIELEKRVITPNSTARVEEQDLDKAVEEAKKRAKEQNQKPDLTDKYHYTISIKYRNSEYKPRASDKELTIIDKIKLEDGRYGSKVTLKSEGTHSFHSMHLDCTTNSGNKIVDAEIEMNEKPKSLLQYYVYPRISTDNTETVEVSIAWMAEFEKIRPTEFKLLIITEADPVNIECRYEEMAYDF